jgi:hypothetical protein
VRIFGFFGADDFELQVVGEKEDFRVRRLKMKVKKYGLFQQLFFVDGEEVKGDWAICNKRFVRRIHRLVIKERRWIVQCPKVLPHGHQVQSWKRTQPERRAAFPHRRAQGRQRGHQEDEDKRSPWHPPSRGISRRHQRQAAARWDSTPYLGKAFLPNEAIL